MQSKYRITNCLYLPARDIWWGTLLLNRADGRDFHKYYWCWWANTNGTISVKRHLYNSYMIQQHVDRKIANKYQPTDTACLYETWKEFPTKLDQIILFESLKNGE